jgi:hypothetical protein
MKQRTQDQCTSCTSFNFVSLMQLFEDLDGSSCSHISLNTSASAHKYPTFRDLIVKVGRDVDRLNAVSYLKDSDGRHE